jgi:hypothetical protein
VTLAVATVLVTETGGGGESVAIEEAPSISMPTEVVRKAHGGIRVRSVLEPQPGHVGFFKVVSTVVQ